MPVVKDGIVGIMSKPLVDLPDACKPLALTKAGEAIWTARRGRGTAVARMVKRHWDHWDIKGSSIMEI